MPTQIHRTELRDTMVLHNTEDYAIEWADGYGQHYLYGIFFEPALFKKVTNKRVSAKTILGIQNMEQRMAALKFIGEEKLLTIAKALLIEKSTRGNELYVIPKESNIFPQNEFFIKYICPSTNRVYIKCVEPEIGKKHDADLAQASTFQFPEWTEKGLEWKSATKEQYQSLLCET